MVPIESEDFNISKIAASGQCFRLTADAPDEFTLIARDRMLRIFSRENGAALDCSREEFSAVWRDYFDLDTDYRRFRRAVAPEDVYLAEAVRRGRGIRILRQEPWEMLVTFLISQRKNIPAIRRSVELLCRACGEPLGEGRFAFPAPGRVAELSAEELSACSLGYRAGYIHQAACLTAGGGLDLKRLAQMDDGAVLDALLQVPGVGPKVANCVLLFGFHRLAGFPRDVWINRVVEEQYRGSFPLERYEGFAGVIQQYLFFHARCLCDERHAAAPESVPALSQNGGSGRVS